MPTGAGKTATATKLAQLSYGKGKSVLFVAHRREIVEQLSEALARWEVPHGLTVAGQASSSERITVASIQTIARRDIQEADLIVVDECHHAVEGSLYERVIRRSPEAYLLGLTATPCRLDGRGLHGFFDSIVNGPTLEQLIDDGYLCRPVIFAPNIPNLKGIKTVGGDYEKSGLEAAMSGVLVGDAIDHFRKLGRRPAIAFCPTVRHACETASRFRSAGFSSEALSGNTSPEDRHRWLHELETGALDVLTSCEVISEGTDIPAVGTAILLRPTQSFVVYMQQIGRALRASEGKEVAVILDHAGNSLRHGLPTQPVEWSLEGIRRRTKADGPAAKRCPHCYAVSRASASVCQDCGHSFVAKERRIRTVSGDLIEVTSTPLPPLKTALSAAHSYNDLLLIEKERGYKHGWAWHYWKNRRRR